jgi:putative methionine-R-sulfoxide reductase with GAF domain
MNEPQTVAEVQAALEAALVELESCEDIPAKLLEEGCKGTYRSPASCPVANFVRKRGKFVTVYVQDRNLFDQTLVVKAFSKTGGYAEIPVGVGVKKTVAEVDAGKLPQLAPPFVRYVSS